MKNTTTSPIQLLGASLVQCVGHPSEHLKRQDWPWCTVEYVLEGSGYLRSNDTECWPQKGDVYVLHRHSRHEYRPDPNDLWKKIFFCVSGSLVDQLWTLYGLDDVHHVNSFGTPDLFDRMHTLAQERPADMAQQVALIFHEVVATMRARRTADVPDLPPDVLRAKEFIDDHVDRPMRLQELCERVGMSEAHLIRTFRTALGVTPYDYLLARRIDQARFLLSNTTMRVKEVAARLQFADASHFSNTFRKRVGQSPKAFRECL